MDESFKQLVKNSFERFRNHVNAVDKDIIYLKEIISRQNNLIKQLSEKINELSEELYNLKTPKNPVSTGNNGVKQINKQINKHLNTSLNTSLDSSELSPNSPEFEGISPEIGLKSIKNRLNITFSKLSKQELKLFLSIYQLEDENIETSYRNIADRLELSEHCVRTYVHSLFRKNAPLYKAKINNKLILIYIDKDFKSLNLKEKLINLYYQNDPYQKKLFDSY